LFQASGHLASLLGRSRSGPDLALGLFGMYNHIDAPSNKQDRLKFGADLDAMPTSFMAMGIRFDRVMPDGPHSQVAFSAISPRLIFHTNWLSREYVIVSYSRFIYGSAYGPSTVPGTTQYAPYTAPVTSLTATQAPVSNGPDPNLVVVSAVISF